MRKKVLITVVTYPLPSRSYDELVCTAGVLEDGTWIRIYPVPFKFLAGLRQDGKVRSYKYTWIELELKRRNNDFRPESHSPEKYDFSDLKILGELDTRQHWALRKDYCLKNVYTNLSLLLENCKSPQNTSLATFKPTVITKFEWEEDDREWKPEWQEQLKQLSLDFEGNMSEQKREIIQKLPYKFYYHFKDETGRNSRMMIEDWEIGQLFWNCLRDANGDENVALEKVRNKYWTEFIEGDHQIYLFLGTTMKWHQRRVSNPFVIIGVFYPKKELQLRLGF